MPLDNIAARIGSEGTPYLPRDLIVKAVYGTLVQVTTKDGFTYYGRRLVTKQAQVLLDQITQAPGAILMRTVDGWVGLEPGDTGQVLITGGPGIPPDWGAAPGAAGNGNWYSSQMSSEGYHTNHTANWCGEANVLLMREDVLLNSVWGFQDQYLAGTYCGIVYEVTSSKTAPKLITATRGASKVVTVNNAQHWIEGEFNTPIELQAGHYYGLGIMCISGGNTTPSCLAYYADISNQMLIPGDQWCVLRLNHLTNAPGDTLDSNSGGQSAYIIGANWSR